jgi:hypothetical protein
MLAMILTAPPQVFAALDLDAEDAFEALRPAHRTSQRVKPSEGLPMAWQSASGPTHTGGLDLGNRD